ncbi:MAG: 2-amino-4-hydroxy-6-hydroxymethyldihydropteridine diphosphokinase [bacterium]
MEEGLVYLALGGNVGDVIGNFKRAIIHLKSVSKLVDVSSVYLSRPYGYDAQPYFYNCVVSCKTILTPFEMLDFAKREEKLAGRVFSGIRFGPRTLDIDILSFGNLSIQTENLKLPHPAIHERDFFIVPLLEIIRDENIKKELQFSLEKLILNNETYVVEKWGKLSLEDLGT